jgi:hypothetical protein
LSISAAEVDFRIVWLRLEIKQSDLLNTQLKFDLHILAIFLVLQSNMEIIKCNILYVIFKDAREEMIQTKQILLKSEMLSFLKNYLKGHCIRYFDKTELRSRACGRSCKLLLF